MKQLDVSSTQYSIQNAYILAQLSKIAYQSKEGATNALKNTGFELVESFSKNHTQAMIITSKNSIIVAFRGTSSVNDLIDDFKIELVPFTGDTKVHLGFKEGVDAIYTELFKRLSSLLDGKKTFWITGHSLGAAEATLFNLKLRMDHDLGALGCYTYGAPRLGDKKFEKLYTNYHASFTFRHVNGNDIVTRIPPRIMGYRHVGKFQYFDVDGKLQEDPKFWQLFKDRVKDIWRSCKNWRQLESLKDHKIDNYLAAIKTNLPSKVSSGQEKATALSP